MHPKTGQLELTLEVRGEAPRGQRSGEAGRAAQGGERSGSDGLPMEQAVARVNAVQAFKRVRRNKGSPGIDGMTVEALERYLHEHWQTIREQLLAGSYQPNAVKRQLIPKSGGGMRELGIPTVLDRFVQQLILQVLQPIFDPDLDRWIHRRLRAVQLKQWKRGRTVFRELRRRNVPEWLAPKAARFATSWWRVAGHGALHTALPGSYFERLGVPRLAANTSTH
jgi:hypothetical protein